ncbi:MAG TPA: sugar phosphate nucleotidyltransferase [Thermoanaerobaculia bacterium]|jgi:mannose-1-phosphate guanylyltransferase|nr:sugar phosphate nucleotidyltransferase [Thermoanaerobaculia bacterium]
MGEEPVGQRWSIVLAGGSGTRLSGLTTVGATTVPKQYCGFFGGPSLLRLALRRATAVAPPERTLVVVAEEHRSWWRRELASLPARNVLVQPRNRGTAVGVLLPLVEVLRRDAAALVAIFPADHHVRREEALAAAVRRSLALAQTLPAYAVLVGVRPARPDGDLGWILPGGTAVGLDGARVAAFREKPPAAEAVRLMRSGGLVNTFILSATARGLHALCERHLPEVAAALGAREYEPLHRLYERLPTRDLSRDVLTRAPESLLVVTAAACGWSDLGTPQRVARCLRAMPREHRIGDFAPAFLDLARQLPNAAVKEISS